MNNYELRDFKKKMREAIAMYIATEGCSCCESSEHGKYKDLLGKMLNVPKYKDGSGYDFSKYKSKTP